MGEGSEGERRGSEGEVAGSPTAFADPETDRRCRRASAQHGHTLYIPSGALWGASDIQKMADRGTLKGLKVTMTKAPRCFRLEGGLAELNETVTERRTVLYEGSVRSLCPLAPNNVNTMAAAAMAAHSLGFDQVQGCLVSDPHHSPLPWLWGESGGSGVDQGYGERAGGV
uniref:Aspartate dehydrogenase domain containing n=1 Tax=Callorhinchus milii TaxID=7868 RepID=A0A4W3GJ05_CALMI